MPEKRSIFGKRTSHAAPYSPAIQCGDLVFISGQVPIDARTNSVSQDGFDEQAKITLQNVSALLSEAGCTFDDCVKVNVYLSDMKNFDRLNEIYKQFFAPPYPARTTVGASLWKNIQIEIDVIAMRSATHVMGSHP